MTITPKGTIHLYSCRKGHNTWVRQRDEGEVSDAVACPLPGCPFISLRARGERPETPGRPTHEWYRLGVPRAVMTEPTVDELVCVRIVERYPDELGAVRVWRRAGEGVRVFDIQAFRRDGRLAYGLQQMWTPGDLEYLGRGRAAEAMTELWFRRMRGC